jgi:hypothetical protein
MNWKKTCGSDAIEQYNPPLAGNGNLSFLVDYQGAQFQKAWRQMVPTIWWAGRRYDTPHRELVPFGHFEQELAQDGQVLDEPQSWQQTLNVKDACIESICTYEPGIQVASKVFVHADRNVIAVTKQFPTDNRLDYTFKYVLSQPDDGAAPPRRMTWSSQTDPSGAIEITYQVDGQHSYEGLILVLSDQPAQPVIVNNCFSLHFSSVRPSVSCFIIMVDNLEIADYRSEAEKIRHMIRLDGFTGLHKTHAESWHAYWAESSASLPEKDIEAVYRTAQYHLRCIATPWSIPVAIANTHWHGRYFGFDEHFGFMGLLTSNHLELARRVPEFRFQGLDRAYMRASRYGKTLFKGGARYPWETVETGEEAAPSGFWLDHIFHMAHIALSSWHYYQFSNDLDFLRTKGYPVIKACAAFFLYQSVYTVADGRTIIGRCTDLERLGSAVENDYMTTCSAIATLQAADRAAGLLGIDAELAHQWQDAAAALKEHLPHDDTQYIPFPGCDQKSVAVLSGLFPYGVIPPEDIKQRRAILDFCEDESAFGNMYPVGKSVCTWYAAWKAIVFARLSDGERAYAATRQGADTAGCFSEIYEINEPAVSIKPWFSTAAGTYLQGVNEMLIQADDKAIHIAPAVPEHWRSFSFSLPCIGGCLVDVAVVDGCLTHLEINDRRPADQSAQPLPRRSVIVPDWLKISDTVAPGLFVQKEL